MVSASQGGVLQRRANMRPRIEGRVLPLVLQSRLGRFLVRQWAWGMMSPQHVWKTASLELQDFRQLVENCSVPNVTMQSFPRLEDLEALARLGNSGELKGNMNRDMMELTGLQAIRPSTTRLPVKKAGTPWGTYCEISILWPHSLFATIFNSFQGAWCERICPSKDELEKFWDSQANHPNLKDHPMTKRANWKRRAVPIAIHGDGVPVTGCGKSWCKSMLVLSWCSMVGHGSTLEMNFLMVCMMTALFMKSGTTKQLLWKRIVWSLQQLFDGQWSAYDEYGAKYCDRTPEGRRAGTNLCGDDGFFGVLWGLKQDLEHLVSEFGWKDYRRLDTGPCGFCPCDVNTFPWKDFRLAKSLWIPRAYDIRTWLASWRNKHCIFDLSGVTLFTVIVDMLHVKYLGTDMYFNASVLWLLCFKVLPGDCHANLEIVWQAVLQWYDSNPSAERYSNLKLSMFCKPASPNASFPVLKGKAAEIRALTPALYSCWCTYMDPGDTQHKEIKIALACSVRVDKILDEQKGAYALPAVAAKEFKAMIFAFLVVQNSLGKWYSEHGMKLFNVTIKSHYLAHLGLNAVHINPRLGFCFQGEDFMGKIKLITGMSARGNDIYQVSGKTLAKYCRGMQLVLEGRGD